jgi:hypothetical protein
VVWAEIEDSNGFCKVRPAVIVTATADIAAGTSLRVVAITTRLPSPLPADHVLLPWDREGKARSGLRRKCAAVASWVADIPQDDIREIIGLLPAAVIKDLLMRLTPPPPPANDQDETKADGVSDS